MQPIDPRTITGADWPDISLLVTFLWVVVVFNIGFAFAMLIGHAVIPSMIATGHIPSRLHSLRPFLYAAGLAALLVVIFIVSNWVVRLPIIFDVYAKKLI